MNIRRMQHVESSHKSTPTYESQRELRKKIIIAAICLDILIIYAVVVGLVGNVELTNEESVIEVPQGATFATLLDWYPNDLHTASWRFSLWRKFNSPKWELQAGEYILPAKMSIREFFKTPGEPRPANETTITLLPGWNVADMQTYFAGLGLTISNWSDFEQQVLAKAVQKYPFLQWVQTLEGILHADTYRIAKGSSAIDVFILLIDTFVEKIYNLHLADQDDWYDKVILASIVEKEEKSSVNRPTIAGILYNRLGGGMHLGVDAAICYQKILPSNECQKFVNQYYAIANKDNRATLNYRYDTRRYIGLVPTPISSVSVSSIEAVLNPIDTDYLYYLHDLQGNVHYALDANGHVANKQKYLR